MASYTDDDRARVRVALQINEGNVKRTARDTGIPISTVRLWKKQWEDDGVPAPIEAVAVEQAQLFANLAEHGRDLALKKWIALVEADKVSAQHLMVGIGILTDKLNLAKGLATARTEKSVKLELPPAEDVVSFAQRALEAARQRAIEIDEADIRELPPADSEPAAEPSAVDDVPH